MKPAFCENAISIVMFDGFTGTGAQHYLLKFEQFFLMKFKLFLKEMCSLIK